MTSADSVNPDDSMDLKQFLDYLEFLFERYSRTYRIATQPYIWQTAHELFPDYAYHPDDNLVRENLMEHVGSLPVMATAFYPHIDDEAVDLGDSLVMLAIHDIGELVTGDEMTFTKKSDAGGAEHLAAIKLLNPLYHTVYKDAESKISKSAKFAKAIDKITPDIIDYLTPKELTLWRYKHYTGAENPEDIIKLIIEHKRPYMTWNNFMAKFHEFLLAELTKKLS